MSDRRRNDRRQTDRRQVKTPPKTLTKLAWPALVASIALLVAVFTWQMLNGGPVTTPVVSEDSKTGILDSKYSFDDFVATDYESFREEVLQRDKEMINEWRKQKAGRQSIQDPDHAVRDYEHRLAELHDALDQFGESADRKGTIGWGLKQDIERLKSDPPYPQ